MPVSLCHKLVHTRLRQCNCLAAILLTIQTGYGLVVTLTLEGQPAGCTVEKLDATLTGETEDLALSAPPGGGNSQLERPKVQPTVASSHNAIHK